MVLILSGCVQTAQVTQVSEPIAGESDLRNETATQQSLTSEPVAAVITPTPFTASTPTPTPQPTPVQMPTQAPSPTSSPTPCIPNWQCTTGACAGNKQTRTCSDVNGCAPATTEIQSCISVNHIIFAEVFYDTPGNESDEEWLALYNPTNARVEVSNWSLTDNTGTWKFSSSISPKSYLTIARNAGGFNNLTGCDADIAGLTRGLNNDGDYLVLKDGNSEIDFVAWEKGYKNSHPSWTIAAQQGKSIKRISLADDTDSVADWSAGTPNPCH